MNDIKLFFAGSAVTAETEDFIVSDRFIQRDEKGSPVLDKDKKPIPIPWKLKGISEEENGEIRKEATKRVPGKNGIMMPETNSAQYMGKLVAACVVFPNLHDAELQKSYGVMGADNLVRKMLLSGEFANLIAKVQQINGYDKDINELAENVKN